jgi:hypothetical protein
MVTGTRKPLAECDAVTRIGIVVSSSSVDAVDAAAEGAAEALVFEAALDVEACVFVLPEADALADVGTIGLMAPPALQAKFAAKSDADTAPKERTITDDLISEHSFDYRPIRPPKDMPIAGAKVGRGAMNRTWASIAIELESTNQAPNPGATKNNPPKL